MVTDFSCGQDEGTSTLQARGLEREANHLSPKPTPFLPGPPPPPLEPVRDNFDCVCRGRSTRDLCSAILPPHLRKRSVLIAVAGRPYNNSALRNFDPESAAQAAREERKRLEEEKKYLVTFLIRNSGKGEMKGCEECVAEGGELAGRRRWQSKSGRMRSSRGGCWKNRNDRWSKTSVTGTAFAR